MEHLLCTSRNNTLVLGTMMSAYHMFLLLTYVLHGQQHPVSNEKFVATRTLDCRMKWIQESLLPKLRSGLRGQRGSCQGLCIQAVKIYLKVARAALMSPWANFQFARNVLAFLVLCQKTVEGDHLNADIDLVPPVVKQFKVLYVKNKRQASVIDALLDNITSRNR
ncbi:uncharacterized protein LOC144136604 [Amblyomma americanum]